MVRYKGRHRLTAEGVVHDIFLGIGFFIMLGIPFSLFVITLFFLGHSLLANAMLFLWFTLAMFIATPRKSVTIGRRWKIRGIGMAVIVVVIFILNLSLIPNILGYVTRLF